MHQLFGYNTVWGATNFGFSRNRRDATDLATFEGIYYTAFSNVGVSHKAYGDLLLI